MALSWSPQRCGNTRTMLVNRIASAILSSLGLLSVTGPLPSALSFIVNQPLFFRLQATTQHHRFRMDSQIFHSTKSEMDEGNNKTRILGVCGGIGSGKSTACKMMVNSLGCIDRIGEYMRDLLVVVYTMFRNSFLFTTLSPGIKTRTF